MSCSGCLKYSPSALQTTPLSIGDLDVLRFPSLGGRCPRLLLRRRVALRDPPSSAPSPCPGRVSAVSSPHGTVALTLSVSCAAPSPVSKCLPRCSGGAPFRGRVAVAESVSVLTKVCPLLPKPPPLCLSPAGRRGRETALWPARCEKWDMPRTGLALDSTRRVGKRPGRRTPRPPAPTWPGRRLPRVTQESPWKPCTSGGSPGPSMAGRGAPPDRNLHLRQLTEQNTNYVLCCVVFLATEI